MRAPCSIDGCDRESQGRGWCGTHWLRWRKHGDPMVVKRPGVDYQVRTVCTVDGCETRAHGLGFCPLHLRRWHTHGNPLVVGERLGRPLKGEHPTWAAVHKRLRRQRGRAADFDCADGCGSKAQEWSYDHSDPAELAGKAGRFLMPYSLDLDRYAPRCTSCHRRFDNVYRLEGVPG